MTPSPVSVGIMIIDGLQLNPLNRDIVDELRRGKVAGVHATCAIWEDARATLSNLGDWFRFFRLNSDIVLHALGAEDIRSAHAVGKVAVILGFQNTAPIEHDISLVECFHRLGVRVMQLTYNNQNLVGGGCFEANDSGLSHFGRLVIGEMNRCGMLVDLSHVGNHTALHAMEVSTAPVAMTHANPISVNPSPRNKPDSVLKALASQGGVIGCTMYPRFFQGAAGSAKAFCAMIERVVEIMGIDHVGIGTDLTRFMSMSDYERLRGRWQFADYGERYETWPPEWPSWFRSAADFPAIQSGLAARGFNPDEIAAVMGRNWMRLFRDVMDGNSATPSRNN